MRSIRWRSWISWSSHSPDQEWTLSHEQYRPFVLFHRTQAAALAQLDDGGPEPAIEEIDRGLEQIRDVFRAVEAEEHFDEDEFVKQLAELRDWIRRALPRGPNACRAVGRRGRLEQYELAARLRDEMARRRYSRVALVGSARNVPSLPAGRVTGFPGPFVVG